MKRLCVVLFIAMALFVSAARADNLADEADLQFQLGADAYGKGDFKGALEHFLASNRLVPNKNVLFNIARTYEQLKQAPDAYRYYVEAAEGETRADQKARIDEALARVAPNVAVLKVTTDPPGATVFLDRRDLGARGTTPRSLGLVAGKHKIILDLAGYEPIELDNIAVTIGQETKVDQKLVPILGTVRIDGEEGTEVRVDAEDSKPLGMVPCTVQIQPGRHTLIFNKPGFQLTDIPIDLPPRGSINVRARLGREQGTLVVNTDVRDALITIDDQPSGFTPAVMPVAVGKHKLRVSLSGFRPIEQDIVVEKGGQVKLDLLLATLEEVTAASRFTEAVEDAPADVTIISQQELRAMGYPTVAEALRGIRSIYISDDTSYNSIGVRGFSRPGDYGNRILVTLDGHPTNDNYIWSSYVGFDGRVDIDDIERIEIVRGPGSVLYGTSAFFAVINLVTRSREQPSHVEVKIDSVQNSMGRARMTGYWRMSKDAGVWNTFSAMKGWGRDYYFPEYDGLKKEDGTPVLDAKGNPTDGFARGVDQQVGGMVNGRFWFKSFTVQWFLNYRDKTLPSGEYGATFGDPRNAFRDTRGFVEARFEPQLGKEVQLLTRLHADMYDFNGFNVYPTPAEDPESTGPSRDRYRGRWGGFEARLQYTGATLRLMGGGTVIQHFQAQQQGEDDVGPYVFDANGNPGRNDPFTVAAGYINADILPVQAFKVSVGVRYDYYSNFSNVSPTDSLNPRLAVVLKPAKNDTFKIMAGKAFRAPSVYELYYTSSTQLAPVDLQPEQIYSAELQYAHRFTQSVVASVAGFVNDVDRLIELNQVSATDTREQYANSKAPVLVYGGEAEVRRDWRQGWMVGASVTVNKAEYLNDSTLRAVPNSPVFLGSLKGAVPIMGRALQLMSRLSVEGGRPDRNNTATDPDQKYTDAGVIWDAVFSGEAERISVRYAIGVYNIMDWQYGIVPSPEFIQRTIPQNGRTIYASLTASF